MRNHAQSVADNGRCPQLCDLYYIEARLYKVERISTRVEPRPRLNSRTLSTLNRSAYWEPASNLGGPTSGPRRPSLAPWPYPRDMKEVFVWGVDTSTGEPWFLQDNTADTYRAHVKAHVRCPVPGCDAELTTVSCSRRRDHLRHLASVVGEHNTESLAHAQGSARLCRTGFSGLIRR